ncbi:retropepsin-like aspartic protease family protein [Kiloniella antarctica]|uniref:TIGR02281 family clan AA aspartic protease n=1 Tax=Kiloniella antarctica TaxID=1550907 RepID=A0ABW5BP15_9PROT
MSNDRQKPFGDKDKNSSRTRGLSSFALLIGVLVLTALGIFLLADRFPDVLSDEDNQIDLVRSLAILLLIMSSLVGMRRLSLSGLSKSLRDISLWIIIFIVLLLGYSFKDEFEGLGLRVTSALMPSQARTTVNGDTIFSKANDGHFYIEGFANNERIKFLVDTGASSIVLSPSDAEKLGYDAHNLNFTQIFETANGTGRGAKANLYSLVIGEQEFRDVRVSINQREMSTSLLGMSFLSQFKSFEFNGDKLILKYGS